MTNARLTPEMREFIEREISNGTYADESDALRAGMRRLMEEQEKNKDSEKKK